MYDRDGNGSITSITRLDAQNNKQFGYDTNNRLVSEQTGIGTENLKVISYNYDTVGNRLSRHEGTKSESYTYSANSNRVEQIGRNSLSYDERGNLIADRNGRRSFSYDVSNRMTEYYKNGELKASYDYNAFGQRIQKTSTTENSYKTLHFAYNPEGWLLSEWGRKTDRKRSFARDYIWLGDRPLAQVERKIRPDGTTRNAEVSFIHADYLNTPRMATNNNGEVVWRWASDAYGVGKSDRDVDGDGSKTVIRLRFPGQYHDSESGLFYNHHRDYDPKLGRYIQSDPIGLRGGVNRYSYVLGNPVNYIDPEGLAVRNCHGDGDGGVTCEYYDDSPSFQHELNWDSGGGSYNFNIEINIFGGTGGSFPELTQCSNGTWVTGGASACPNGETVEAETCNNSSQGYTDYLDSVLGRRGPTEDYEFSRVADSLEDLPASLREDLYGNPITNDFSSRGWHESNIRLPSPDGSPGGYHLHTERANGAVFAHFDAFNGATNTFAHGMEVGMVPMVNPNVTYWSIFDVFPNMITNTPGGPSTIEEIENSAKEPSESLESFCEK